MNKEVILFCLRCPFKLMHCHFYCRLPGLTHSHLTRNCCHSCLSVPQTCQAGLSCLLLGLPVLWGPTWLTSSHVVSGVTFFGDLLWSLCLEAVSVSSLSHPRLFLCIAPAGSVTCARTQTHEGRSFGLFCLLLDSQHSEHRVAAQALNIQVLKEWKVGIGG